MKTLTKEIKNWVQVGLNIARFSANKDPLFIENALIEKGIPKELLKGVMNEIKNKY